MTGLNQSLKVHTLILPKAGLERSECEDSIGTRSSVQRFCVADGATEDGRDFLPSIGSFPTVPCSPVKN
jgi:hypothetical protein